MVTHPHIHALITVRPLKVPSEKPAISIQRECFSASAGRLVMWHISRTGWPRKGTGAKEPAARGGQNFKVMKRQT